MNCPNCQNPLSCGCQKRKASDGKEVCTNCLPHYELMMANLKKIEPFADESVAPKNVTVTFTQKPASQ